MTFAMTQADFLAKKEISPQEWDEAEIDWATLVEIAEDFNSRYEHLCSNAEYISSRLRTFPGVHSVRWRIKNVENLLKKIIRKKLNPTSHKKWRNVNAENYATVVTDLIGVRALHLLTNECIGIDEEIRKEWRPTEVTIWRRDGDAKIEQLKKPQATFKLHPAGYRSIHYLVKAQEKLTVEIQVRTIFQEGWSEIDHKVKYPDHSNNKQIEYFLKLFNSLAGSADDMGSYIVDLVRYLEEKESRITHFEELAHQQTLTELSVDEHLDRLTSLQKQDTESQNLIKKLRAEIQKLRSANIESLLVAANVGVSLQGGTPIHHLSYGDAVAFANATGTATVTRFRGAKKKNTPD